MNVEPWRDRDLMRRLFTGDETALRELETRFRPRLLGLAARLLNDDIEAGWRAVHEVFIRVVKNFQTGARVWNGESAWKSLTDMLLRVLSK